jgi:N6-L-threonylcarbamoyladenine synthase
LSGQNLKFTLNSKLEIENYLKEITHIAVTNGPGLVGALLIGYNTAKTLAYLKNIPLIPINHIEGHIYSALLNKIKSQKSKVKSNGVDFPIISLTVSGGHTSLTLVTGHGRYQTLGQTRDDAAGEAFDKVAKLLGLGYPGGPAVSKLAEKFRESKNQAKITFPRPMINDKSFDFSFSGLKTAVINEAKRRLLNLENERFRKKETSIDDLQLTTDDKKEVCFAFEEAVVDLLATKTLRAAKKYQPKGIILAGGVSANQRLQEEFKTRIEDYNKQTDIKNRLDYYLPPRDMTGDNAAMIGLAAYYRIKKQLINHLVNRVDSNLKL